MAAKAPTTRALETILSLESWIPSILLGRIRDTKRENGKRKASSVGGKYAYMRRFGDVLRHSLPHGDTGDLAVLDKVDKETNPTCRVVRRTADDGQTGPTSKQKRGRMAADVWETQKLSKEMVAELLEPNGPIMFFMSKVTGGEEQLSLGVLAKHGLGDPGNTETENHLDTPEVRAAAKRLIDEERITCDDIRISELSKALFLIDCVTSPTIRPQSRQKLWASKTFVHSGDGALMDVISQD